MRDLFVVSALLCATGCALEATPLEEEEGVEQLGTGASALQQLNSLLPNALAPNAMVGNAMVGNAMVGNGMVGNGLSPARLASSALSPDSLLESATSALVDPGELGAMSRMFLKYAVSCAFERDQSFRVTFRDEDGLRHDETYAGLAGLAPEWQQAPLDPKKQRWVSACMAARTNYFGVSVTISMRGQHASLGADEEEREAFAYREGAFWGNLFTETPSVFACHDPSNASHARRSARICATGLRIGGAQLACGILQRTGDCSRRCAKAQDEGLGFAACAGTTEVVTAFLR